MTSRPVLAAACLLSALAVLPIGGCLLVAGAAAGAGGYAYATGALVTTQPVGLDKAWAATQAGIGDLQFTVTEQTKDAMGAQMVATMSNGKTVKINLKPDSDAATEFRIRVGTFGDEDLSTQIMDKIKARF